MTTQYERVKKDDINMNDNRTRDEIYKTAFHEAAHAVMCILKRTPLVRVVVNDYADEQGRLGCCYHIGADYFRDSVWISLAGPAADSLREQTTMSEAFFRGGSADFDKAYDELGRIMYPHVPDELQQHIGTDVRAYLTLWFNDWIPEGVRGQTKRKLTLFTKKCLKADDYVCDWVHREAAEVRNFLQQTPGIYASIEYLADHLYNVRQMTGKEVIELMWPYYREQQEAGKLAA